MNALAPVGAIIGNAVSQAIAKGSKGARVSQSRALVPYVPPPQKGGRAPRARKRPPPSEGKSVLRAANASAVAAPVAIGINSRGTDFTFGAAPLRGGMKGCRLSGKQLWATVASNLLSNLTACLLPYGAAAGSNNSVQFMTFDPDDVLTMPPPIVQLSSIFGRYALKKCRLIFTPSIATSTNAAFGLAAITDAALVQSNLAGSAPTFLELMQFTNSVTGPAWSPMSLEIPCDGELRYTYQSNSDANIGAAEERQDHAFGILGQFNGTTNTGFTYGYLHLEYVIDFYEVGAFVSEVHLRRDEKRVAKLRARFDAARRQFELTERGELKEEKKAGDLRLPATTPVSGGYVQVDEESHLVPSRPLLPPLRLVTGGRERALV